MTGAPSIEVTQSLLGYGGDAVSVMHGHLGVRRPTAPGWALLAPSRFPRFLSQFDLVTQNSARDERCSAATVNRGEQLYGVTKRVMDIVGALLLLIVTSPLMALVALAVKYSSPGPILFSQKRLTRNGKVFMLRKFRTMRADAEVATGPVWAAEVDPRVTTVGRFLRKTRLDELPQLVNVIRGEMSFVGPRPERPEMAEELLRVFPRFNQRLAVTAGLTGWAQIKHGYAGSIETYRRKLALDLVYIKHRSLWFDIVILVRTLRVLCSGSGAR